MSAPALPLTAAPLTADQALEACRALGLRYEADLRQPDGLWWARCPLCVLTTEGLKLEVRESGRGRPARLACQRGCESAAIIDHLRRALVSDDLRCDDGPIRFLDVAAMVADPPPAVPWLAPPVLPRASLTALYAPGGDGKSLFAAALCCAIAEGGEVAGIACETGTAVYLDGENGEHEIWRRVHTLGMPPAGVRMADASGFDLRRDLEVLAEVFREHGPDAAVLDSFRSLTPGLDENDTKQTAAALDPLRRLAHESGTAILLIHHTNKAGRDYRGASSIRDSCDVLWHLGRHEDDDDRERRFLACRKMRVAAEPARLWLRLEVDRGRVLIDQAEAPLESEPARIAPVRAALSDEILASMNGSTLRLAEIAELVDRKPKDGSVRNALGALIADGLMQRDGTGYALVQGVQTAPIAPLHPCTEEVQSANTLKGDCTLHLPAGQENGGAKPDGSLADEAVRRHVGGEAS